MENRWSDAEAQHVLKSYQLKNVDSDLALRVYTSRLLGKDTALVLHGGGNTSVKLSMQTVLGESVNVLCVKGSGWDLESIEPEGLPAVCLEPLLKLRCLSVLSDESMVNFQRTQLIQASAPNPSIETLLHAFIPARYIDHTHANAILSMTNQVRGEEHVKAIYGKRFGVVPYIKPGFDLAKAAADVYDSDPSVEGLILLQHGIFTFGDTAKESYDRMIQAVTDAEHYIQTQWRSSLTQTDIPSPLAALSEVAPVLRGACALREGEVPQRILLHHRCNDTILQYVNGKDLARYSQVGVVTPDHIIRTKNYPLLLPPPKVGELGAWRTALAAALKAYAKRYQIYFSQHNGVSTTAQCQLDALPRVVLIPGLGLFGLGKTPKDAAIVADIAEATIKVITDAEAVGAHHALSEADLFDMEYWSLEQAKLAKAVEQPLTRQVVAITGGAGTIGAATARAFSDLGATVVLLDLDELQAKQVAQSIHASALGLGCDVTDPQSVSRAFKAICDAFGGLDIMVSNAGCAYTGKIGDVSDELLRKSFELNFFAHQSVAQQAVKIMRQQGTGGTLLFNVSKQALNPGKDFGPYGLPKAATLALVRQYALDHAEDGIRVNAVNADRIRSGLLTTEMIATRSKARGLSEDEYMGGNLLGSEVTAEDVAQAFVHQALARKTTAGITTVDGGNMAAAVR